MRHAAVECHDLALGYGRTPVLAGVDLRVEAGRLLALLGPSGSGKTTLLHAVAGFVAPRAGRIVLAGTTVSTSRWCVHPEQRSLGVVFQNYALWPHLTALDNVAYPIRRAGASRAQARQQAAVLLEQLDVAQLADRRPAELSGGQQQRVGLARALARRPATYLFDEPTAHLDAHLRGVLLEEVARHREQRGAAALYATHDAAEALAVADRVAVLDAGAVVQVDAPQQVYERPATVTAARLTGPASVLRARAVCTAPGHLDVVVGDQRVRCAADQAAAPGDRLGRCERQLLVRPEWARLEGELPGRLAAVRFRGPHTDYTLDTSAGQVTVREPGPPRHPAGAAVSWSLLRAWPLPSPQPAVIM